MAAACALAIFSGKNFIVRDSKKKRLLAFRCPFTGGVTEGKQLPYC